MQNTAQLFSVILHCVKMRKGDTINFRLGGRLTTYLQLCSAIVNSNFDRSCSKYNKFSVCLIIFLLSQQCMEIGLSGESGALARNHVDRESRSGNDIALILRLGMRGITALELILKPTAVTRISVKVSACNAVLMKPV